MYEPIPIEANPRWIEKEEGHWSYSSRLYFLSTISRRRIECTENPILETIGLLAWYSAFKFVCVCAKLLRKRSYVRACGRTIN